MLLLQLIIIFGSLTCSGTPKRCSCTPATKTQLTHWGHRIVVFDLQRDPVKAIHGAVRDANNQPVEGVLVEIYRRRQGEPPPDHIVRDGVSEERFLACVTGPKGEYEFELPSGYFELRSSKIDWNSTSLLVTVNVRSGSKKNTDVRLEIGD
jgi:hypothetical protein